MKIQTYRDAEHYSALFDAKFKLVATIEEATDLINKPHKDDYPTRVDKTAEVIRQVTPVLVDSKGSMSSYLLRTLHDVFYGDDDIAHRTTVNAGGWRTHAVGFDHSGIVPPDHFKVREMIEQCMENYNSIMHAYSGHAEEGDLFLLQDWYRIFETIHPFNDGNGRVGGIIVAAASYYLTGKYLAALQ